MVSARCQRVRGACIVGKPTPTAIRAEHCISGERRLACDGIGAVSASARRLHRWQANSHSDPRRALHFRREQACLRWYRRGVSTCAAPASLASQLPQRSAQSTAFPVGAGLPAMVSARCQYVRGACIVGEPTPTAIRAEHCISGGSRLACDGIGAVSVRARRLHRWQANSHREHCAFGIWLRGVSFAGFSGAGLRVVRRPSFPAASCASIS